MEDMGTGDTMMQVYNAWKRETPREGSKPVTWQLLGSSDTVKADLVKKGPHNREGEWIFLGEVCRCVGETS